MSHVFTFLSWNIRHFDGRDPARLERVVKYIKGLNVDIISLYEIKGSKIYNLLHDHLPDYVWANTSGRQSQEILVGVRKNCGTIGFEQSDSFKGGNNFLRPGLLTSIKCDDKIIVFLSLHLKSGIDFVANATRLEQFDAMRGLSRTLKAKGIPLVVMGDVNTMGLDLSYGYGFDTQGEFHLMHRKLKNAGLEVKAKDWDHTWTPSETSRYKIADLDHVFASHGLEFIPMGDGSAPQGHADIRVDWPSGYSPRTERSAWWRDGMSDHAPLIGRVKI